MKRFNRVTEALWKARYKKIPAFIHIPKTGGTYIKQLENKNKQVIYPLKYFGHSYVIDETNELNVIYLKHDFVRATEYVIERDKIKDYFVFASVRNIFEWLVSYADHAGGWTPRYKNINHYDYDNANKGFEYLIKTIANREDQWPCRKMIHCQLFSSGGDLIVDHLIRTSSLDNDLEEMAKRLKIKYRSGEKQRLGLHNDYRTYYNDELIDLVYKIWKKEIELFGSEFDKSVNEKAILKNTITEGQKTNIKYYWDKDLLLVHNQS